MNKSGFELLHTFIFFKKENTGRHTKATVMDGHRVYLWCLMVVFGPLCRAAPVSDSFAVLAGSPVSVQRGLTATLPCWLAPSQSAEDLEVRWYRGSNPYDTPVMLYKSKMFDHESQKASYAGRVDFGFKDPTSDGLRAGDVSLKLTNVTIEDAGDYTCLVSSFKEFESSSISLRVTETGSPPILSVVWKNDNMVNLSCESEGWYPQPELHWSDRNDKELTTNNLANTKDPAGLFSVHSWRLVPDSSEMSCSVGLSKNETKMARIRLGSPQRSMQESSSSSAGWVAFGILLVALAALAVAAALYFKKRAQSNPGGDQTDENEPFLLTVPEQLSKFYVNVKLVDTKNPFITIRGSLFRDAAGQMFPDGDRVTCCTAVRGRPGFSSGRHYWEVSLSFKGVEPKKSWWIGVTNTEIPNDASFTPNTSNGFWFLSSSPERDAMVQFSTEPETRLPVQSPLKTVGVFLNYEAGELSFYNVDNQSLIVSLPAKFTGEVFPVFNPGKSDKSPMEIIQKTEEDSVTNDNRNCDSVAQEIEQPQ